MQASQMRTHDDPPSFELDEKEGSGTFYVAPKDKRKRLVRFGISIIRFGGKISGINILN